MTMTRLTTLVAAALLSAIAAAPALAFEPAAYAAQYPDRDILNGGALTPAGRAGLENAGGAASLVSANRAAAGLGNANASVQPLATGSRRHGRHHSRRTQSQVEPERPGGRCARPNRRDEAADRLAPEAFARLRNTD